MIVNNAEDCIPFFQKKGGILGIGAQGGLKGAARSMPTSCALDHVCKVPRAPPAPLPVLSALHWFLPVRIKRKTRPPLRPAWRDCAMGSG